MNQINKLTVLLSSLALLVGLLIVSSPKAEACGSYGPLTEEEQVSRAVHSLFWSKLQPAGPMENTWIELDSVEVTAGRVAIVHGHTVSANNVVGAKQTFALYNVDGQWTVAQQPSMVLLVTSLKHALDANIKPTLDQPHNAVEFTAINPKTILHSVASVAK